LSKKFVNLTVVSLIKPNCKIRILGLLSTNFKAKITIRESDSFVGTSHMSDIRQMPVAMQRLVDFTDFKDRTKLVMIMEVHW
jgi:hypothetical protein